MVPTKLWVKVGALKTKQSLKENCSVDIGSLHNKQWRADWAGHSKIMSVTD